MKVVQVTSVRLVNDDGSALHPAVEAKAMELMQGFKDDRVLGDASPVNNASALRMVATVMERFKLVHKVGTLT